MGKGINVNAIAPGYVETDSTKATVSKMGLQWKQNLGQNTCRKMGLPADLAGSIIHLYYKSGDYIAGEMHAVDRRHLVLGR